jgi:hypothetical protein
MQAKREIAPEELVLLYQDCFGSPAGKVVLTHLVAKFGFTNKSTNVPGDPYGTHVNEGHRGVLVYIGKMLSMTPDDMKQPTQAESETSVERKGAGHDEEF